MNTLTIQEINGAITNQIWTNAQIQSMAQALKFAQEQLTRKTRWQLKVGDSVKFANTRTGRIHYGTVNKINIKRVIVQEGTTRWTVPANMLEAA